MKRVFIVFGVLAIMVGVAEAQEKKPEASPGQGVTLPKPGPEQEILKKDVGVWDATVEAKMAPDAKPDVTKGVETITLLGGLWLIQDFKGEFMGQPYHGHMVTGYDSGKKKYVGTWIDSMSVGLTAMEGTYDAKTRTMTSTIEGPCPEGLIMKMRTTTLYPDDSTRVFSMFSPASMGPEFVMMKITYKRRPTATTATR